MTWANESECCEHPWTVNGSSTFNVFLFVSPCFARSYCWFYMPKKLLPFFRQACVLGAAPVGALSYGFWTFTQRAAETRQSCCRRHVSCWALWMYQKQEGRVGLLNMLNSRDLTWLHLVQQHVRHSEEWFLANPVVRNPNLMIEFDEIAWNYTATSIIMWNLTSFCKGTALNRSERLASSQSCQYILWDEETDFYPAQRLGLLGGKSPMNAWTSLQAIQARSIVMSMWISWKTAMKLWSSELCWSVF